MDTYLGVLKKYAEFSGRASRKEYWTFCLVNFGIALLLGVPTGLLKAFANVDLTFLPNIYSLAVLCPGIAVSVRRLHDTDRSGWWALVGLIPLIGGITLLVFMCLEGNKSDNKFGSSPY